MKRIILFPLIIIFCISCQQQVDIDKEKEAIKIVIDNYAKSWITEDIELYSSTVMHDESLIHVGGSKGLNWIEGWTELKNIIINQNQDLNDTKIDEKKSWINLSNCNNFSWAVTLWDLTTTLNDGTKCLIPLRCTWILEKINGSWIIVHFHKSIGIRTVREYAIDS
jgi:ketosteroid isomerase-like protein